VTSVADALASARRALPAGEARLLLQQVLGWSAARLAAYPEHRLAAPEADAYAQLVARRSAGEPVAYLLGQREFFGRDFQVSPAVLIPRPETELLVEIACGKCAAMVAPRILDLGTGSGCLAVTLALEMPAAAVIAVDVSPAALAVARVNGRRLGAQVEFLESDWLAAVAGRFHLIVSNPPYVAEGDPHLVQGDLRHEPAMALACGPDGLAAIRRIVAEAPEHLVPGGWLFLEHGYDQAPAVAALLADAGLGAIEQHRDLAGIVRVSGGRLTAPAGRP
jgi:release factor glutamine methyltransferase